jgi:hypothetical protein
VKRGGHHASNRRRQTTGDTPATLSTHRCALCHKDTYRTKSAAKRVARAHYPRTHTWPVRCPTGDGWHYSSIKPDTTEEDRS